MKKLAIILLIICMMTILFVACNDSQEQVTGEESSSTQTVTEDVTETDTETSEATIETTEEITTEAEEPTAEQATVEETTAEETTAEETTVEEATVEETTAEETTVEETTVEETTVEETTVEETTVEETTVEETTVEETTVEETTVEETTEAETINWSPYPEEGNTVTKYPYTDENGVIHIAFQDSYNFGKLVASVENIEITSFQTGTNTPDENVLKISNKLGVYATACGTAKVILDEGTEYTVTVHPAPINLLFLTGQSNGAGDPPSEGTYDPNEYQKYFLRSEERMAYYVFTNQTLTVDNAKNYVPNNLVWEKCFTNTLGCDPKALTSEVGTGFKNYAMCAGLAYEWTKETGERVFIVNASHGGQPIHCFKPSEDGTVVDNDYYQAVTIFNLALETMYREVDAGHFTLNHMAYYWYQGEGDSSNTADYYLDAFAEMHAAMMEDVVYSHNGVEKKLEYCGIMTVRSCKDSSGNSDLEYYITGPRLAQYTAANKLEGVLSNVFLASKATEEWIGGDANVESYFLRTYVSKGRFKSYFGYDMPVTMDTVKPGIHYRIFGHNEMGVDAARNTLQFLNFLNPDSQYELSYKKNVKKPELTLVSRDGYTPVGDFLLFDAGTLEAYLIPYITPVWRTVEGLSLKAVTEGIRVDGFRLYITDTSIREFTVEIYLGDKLMDTRTFDIKMKSSFADNQPLYINHGTSKYPDREFERYVGAWDAGLLSFEDGSFTVYDQFNKDTVCLNAGGKDGFDLARQMSIMQAEDQGKGSLGIRFTAAADGKVVIGADYFYSSSADCYIAIFVNGEKVAPVSDKAVNHRGGWYLIRSSYDASSVTEQFQGITLDLKAGDEVVFALTLSGENTKAVFHPYVTYILKKTENE